MFRGIAEDGTVENRLILNLFRGEHFQLTFNTGLNNLDSQWAGLLIFDESGQVLSANRRADNLLGLSLSRVSIESLFKVSLMELLNQPDGLHPNQTGYDEMAEITYDKLRDIFRRCPAAQASSATPEPRTRRSSAPPTAARAGMSSPGCASTAPGPAGSPAPGGSGCTRSSSTP